MTIRFPWNFLYILKDTMLFTQTTTVTINSGNALSLQGAYNITLGSGSSSVVGVYTGALPYISIGHLSDASACLSCPDGKYSTATGASVCSICPANSGSASGSSLLTDCSGNAGLSGSDGGPCIACGQGSGSLCCNFQTSSTRRPQEQACERAVLLGPTLRQAVMLRKTARA
jgi:hypothetical protein